MNNQDNSDNFESNSIKKSFQEFCNNLLNEDQKKAVYPKNGSLLIHAGAGSGKTRVITSRIASLIINHNVDPDEILALTFTNKAAKEMKERISNFFKGNIKLPYVGTFHSYCLKTLKKSQYFNKLNADFTLIDQDDQNKIIKNLIKKYNLEKKITSKQILSFISKIKNECPKLEKSSEFLISNNIYKELYLNYEEEKKISNCLDFDDLIIKTYDLFQKIPEFKIKFQQSIKHILVDEYQDTNQIQHLLLKSMTLDQNLNFALDSICVVGDEDQSIYSWRGATVLNMINFKDDFKDTKIITLDQNYRSVQPILYTANNLIQNNKTRNIKNLWSSKKAKDRIKIMLFGSTLQEGYAICEFLRACQLNNNTSNYNAILYRSHFQSRTIEEALIRYSIPYKIVGGIQFYDRLEIKDIIAYLRLILNPFDRPAFIRIINTPNRGFGEKFQEQYLDLWDEQPFLNFKEIANYIIENNLITKIKAEILIKFLEIFNNLSSIEKPSTVLNQIIYATNYFDYLDQNFDKDEAKTKKENIKELLNSAIFFENNNLDNFTIKEFLEEISLLQELISSNNNTNTQVYLMTFHAAKGLEFDNVIIAGAEEGVLPSNQSIYTLEALEEERRLMYVGITRARERLIVTHTSQRIIYGQNTNQKPSRFISELPDNHIQKEDCSNWTLSKLQSYFQQWLLDKPDLKLDVNQNVINNTKNYKFVDNNKNWKIKQKVEHPTFGIGIIENIEDTKVRIYLTIKFKDSIKKIDSKFLKII